MSQDLVSNLHLGPGGTGTYRPPTLPGRSGAGGAYAKKPTRTRVYNTVMLPEASARSSTGAPRMNAYTSRFDQSAMAESATAAAPKAHEEPTADSTVLEVAKPAQSTVSLEPSKISFRGGAGEVQSDEVPDDLLVDETEHTDAARRQAEKVRLRTEHESSQVELMTFLDEIRDDEDGNQFNYLMPMRIDDFPANPYHLRIVPHAAVDDADFFTISSSGVTHFSSGTAEFTQLDQWQREYYLFNEILHIRMFKVYRIWKAFKVWRRFVKSKKVSVYKTELTKQLFVLNPIFQKAMLTIKEHCCLIADGPDRLKLHSLKSGIVFRLEDFVLAQEKQAEEVVQSLKELHDATLKGVKEACAHTLSKLTETLFASNVGGGFGGDEGGFGDSSGDLNRTAAGDTVDNSPSKFSYTVLAARRAEHRKLHHFIRLTDYIIRDTLHAMVVSSAQDVLDFMHAPRMMQSIDLLMNPVDENAEGEPEPEPEPEAESAEVIEYDSALFEIEVLDQGGPLIFLPSQLDFRREIDKMLSSFVMTVSSVPHLSSETLPSRSLYEYTSLVEVEDVNEDALEAMIAHDQKYRVLLLEIQETLVDAFSHAENCKQQFVPFLEIVRANEALNINVNDPSTSDKSLDSFKEDMVKYNKQVKDIERLPTCALLGLIQLNTEQLKDGFAPAPKKCLQDIEELLPVLGQEKVKILLHEINSGNTALNKGEKAGTVEDFCVFLTDLEALHARIDGISEAFNQVEEHYALMTEQNVSFPEHQKAEYQSLSLEYANLKSLIDIADSNKSDNIQKFTVKLEGIVKTLKDTTQETKKSALRDELFLEYTPTGMEPTSKVMTELVKLDEDVDALKAISDSIIAQQKLFNKNDPDSTGTVPRFEELQEVIADVKLKKRLWESLRTFGEQTEAWAQTKFEDLDAELMGNEVQLYQKTVLSCERDLPSNNVVPELKEMVNVYKNTVPVVVNLRNKALKDRHWDKIEGVIGNPIPRDNPEEFTLKTLLDLHVMHFKEQIETISVEATQEGLLEAMLASVIEKWATTEFVLDVYKEQPGVYILSGIDEIITLLDDSMVTMGTITASRFVGGIREKVEQTEQSLNLFSETLDEALAVQRNWMYLEAIFCAPDIQRQLPEEAKSFFDVDKIWKAVLKTTRDTGNAFKSFIQPGLLETFQKACATLDRVQNRLEDYLETKRMAFPRFYFLSNDELLEILAQTRNPQAVQPHMGKCFDGIKKLEFGGGQPGKAETADNRIYGMYSPDQEYVDFGDNLKARGNVENWLTATETEMRTSLRRFTKAAIKDYEAPGRLRKDWVLDHAAQVVLTVSLIEFTKQVMGAFEEEDVLQGMVNLLETQKAQLFDLTQLVIGTLTKLQRKIISTLITLDVHNRDTCSVFIADKVLSPGEFKWQMQLRFYWEADADNCRVRQTNACFWYGYEYLGAEGRLVVTPMTDRCYMTLSGALHLKLGGAPAGPAGTGKTETTKDLAKGLGFQCVVFNCGDNLDYKFMGKFFKGLCQCGAWACFDEFNRISLEVLSVVAQQMISIQNALRAIPAGETQSTFNFEGVVIKIIETFGAFITMNPGYAGRTELPDNLKVLFRPVSMMIPNYTMVAEVMLFSEGFTNAKVLSVKFIKLYKLSSEQLSQQDHYDFGMRAVKSVLVMAGALNRANPELSEDVTLIRAMRDSNIPKFLQDDVILFQALISDLFPGVEIPENDYGELLRAIQHATAEQGLQVTDNGCLKSLQLYETLNVRFGVMIVGPTGGGKTACYVTLQKAMTYLREQESENEEMQTVLTYVLNPKCISMGELYGEFNEVTTEWKDGLGSGLMRDATASQTKDRKWIVFDGPVDAIWIENMNTVLDDNRTLCLPNGERIKLNGETMRALFEVQDLRVASPATVSRCGMVWIAPEALGWRPFVQTWLAALHEKFTPAHKDKIMELFENHVDNGMNYYRKNVKEAVPTVDINLVVSLCRIFESLSGFESDGGGQDIQWEDEETSNIDLGLLFVFAYTWSIGGNSNAEAMDVMEDFIRNELETSVQLPPAGSLYELYVDTKEHCMKQWKTIMPEFKYNSDISYLSLLVPTMDTVRYGYLAEYCLDVNKSVLFTGDSGTGKTAVVQSVLGRIEETKKTLPVSLIFSAQTSSPQTQSMIEAKLEKVRKKIFGPPGKKNMALFVDDINMPAREEYGAQAPIELLRQFQDFHGFYDREKWFWKDIVNVTLLAACAPPGGGRNEVTPRFFRHFNVLCISPASEDVLKTIFTSIMTGFLDEEFVKDVRDMAVPLVKGTIQVYKRISEELLPTPAKSHYTFNLRDVSKTFQGILMVKAPNVPNKVTMTRLWCHECMRVFHDRLIDNDDQRWFKELMLELVQGTFSMSWDYDDTFINSHILFGDYLKMGATGDDRSYEEVPDLKKLNGILDEYLFEYNMSNPVQMNLVFFRDAMEHISRVARVLRLEKGNAMLVGVGGSGKQSTTRLASAMAEYKCFNIELKKGYDLTSFREDIKALFEIAGVNNTPVTFLLVDTQIVDESMLEDVNNILNTGEVPGLYPSDEKEKIIADMRPYCEKMGLPASKDGCWAAFVGCVLNNLHIVLCMSPVGDAFRRRCRLFPSLINCTTIDWFTPWPDEALQAVAQKLFEQKGGDLVDPELQQAVCDMCVVVHQSTMTIADEFLSELRRHYYITPKSYLDLINLYLEALKEKRAQKDLARNRLVNGLQKLHDCNHLVAEMETTLTALAPVLKEKSEATAVLLVQVAKDQTEAEAFSVIVKKETAEAEATAAEVKAIADDAQADLDLALPALDNAVKALNALTKGDITEIKSFSKPPPLVQTVMEAVCVMKGVKADWDNSKKQLSDSKFMESLINYDKDNIGESTLKKLKKYIDMEGFNPDAVGRVSNAAKGLCMWCCAMDVYARVAKNVEPKKKLLSEANAKLKVVMDTLGVKKAALQEVEEKVAGLQKMLKEAQDESQRLQDEAGVTEGRLGRAGKLTSALGDEAVRWKAETEDLASQITLLVGDVFLCSGCVSYFGAFDGAYRDRITALWHAGVLERGIPCSDTFSLSRIMGEPVQIRQWQVEGLPSDQLSIDNGILVTRAKRWPLMIDPQEQANKWIKSMESRAGLRLIKLSDGNFLRQLEGAIRIGSPVLCEDIGEEVDPALEPVLLKAVIESGGRRILRLGETDVDYDDNFRFYMTSKLPNPHYMPELCIKVTLINFTVTMSGLEDQLLADVVAKERPDLEETKNKLVLSMANDAKQLKELEDRTLHLLSTSEGNILDNEPLINTLNNSKLTSGVIKQRVEEAEKTEIEINEARELYRPVSTRSSLIYFVVADLGRLDPMYQYSLAYFKGLFAYCIDNSEKSDDLDTRLHNLIEFSTYFDYITVSRGLFEAHRLIFPFLICTSIKRHEGEIAMPQWNFLIRGKGALVVDAGPNPDPTWISPEAWDLLNALEEMVSGVFDGLCEDIKGNVIGWGEWFDSPAPQTTPMPGIWGIAPTEEEPNEHFLDTFNRLLVLKSIKPDKLTFALSDYVAEKLGERFVEMPPLKLADIYGDTSPTVPTIFILSTGADPTSMLLSFADDMGYSSRFHIISLGQGQGPKAEQLINKAKETGDWVCLQNCHLATSWLPTMEKIIEDFGLQSANMDPDFRLWLMSFPSTSFPVATLQSSIKLTNEPPKGLRANIGGTLGVMKEEDYMNCSKPRPWQKLLFGLSFFHAVIQERRKFGPLGWNVRYAFNASDLECSLSTLRMFLDENEEIPWESLVYVTGQINYGGRVTDDNDRRLLMTVLEQYYTPDVIGEEYKYSESGIYFAPPEGKQEAMLAYTKGLPVEDAPEVFGMHQNALIAFNTNETNRVIDTILSIQPRIAGVKDADVLTPEQMVAALCAETEKNMPLDLDPEECSPGLFDRDPETGQMDSLATVLIQEIERFNSMLAVLRLSLKLLQKAIKGLIVMSGELEQMFNDMLINKVPGAWAKVAYPSLMPLGSWINDLHNRMEFFHAWNKGGVPVSFPLPYIFFSVGFLTGSLQKHARKHVIPIDSLSFSFKVMTYTSDEDLDGEPEDGCYVRGLFVEAAMWDMDSMTLQPSLPGEMTAELPFILIVPVENYQMDPTHYQCPLYRTSVRAGVLTTTGASSNFVCDLSLPCDRDPSFFVLQGTAALSMVE